MFDDDGICTKCGQVHTECSAHNREDAPCGRKAMKHLTVCNVHGGHAKQTRQAAAKREAASMASKAYSADPTAVLAAEGVEPVQDPLLALGKLATSAETLMARLGARLNYLEAEDLTWESRDGQSQVSELLKAYERAMDRTAKLMDMLIKAGFQERALQIDEFHAKTFNSVMRAVLGRLNLTPEDRQAVPGIVVEELHAVEQRQATSAALSIR